MTKPVEIRTPRYAEAILDSGRARSQASSPAVIGMVAGTLFLFASGFVEGQQHNNLTRAQAGRVAVAQCYAHCMELSYNQTMETARFVLDALAGRWSAQNVVSTTCEVLQTNAIAGDMCKAGCMDIEASYGVRSSHIRSRFQRALNEYLRDVRTSGLWIAWNRYPESGTTAFSRACARYAQIVNARSAQFAQTMKDMQPLNEAALRARREEVIANEYYPEPPPVWDE